MLSKSKLCPVLVLLLLAGTATTASAKLTISKAATKNVSCSAGVCSATAASAWLNVNDLQNLLASSSVTVTAGSAAQDIIVGAPLTWASASALTLDAYRSVAVYQPVSDAGPGALTIATNDGGHNSVFRFLGKGSIGFLGISNGLTIDGIGYMLVNSLASLSTAVNANSSGHIALANDYDASADGTYALPPVITTYSGDFNGLGHTISNLTIKSAGKLVPQGFGLFSTTDTGFAIEHLHMTSEFIHAPTGSKYKNGGIGGIVGYMNGNGTLSDVSVSGTLSAKETTVLSIGVEIGGIVGYGQGTISDSHANVTVSYPYPAGDLGGLAGDFTGSITNSFSAGSLSGGGALGGLASVITGSVSDCYSTVNMTGTGTSGGLVGALEPSGTITNSFATGSVSGGQNGNVGGLVGVLYGDQLSQSYSTGSVSCSGSDCRAGGLIGSDGSNAGSITSAYWDTDTSGTSTGIGYSRNGNTATGLTTAQLQSGLPAGFSSAIWGETTGINNGLPYLLALPAP